VEQREEFCLFVSTRPCPKCTAAIVDAQIFNVYFLYENNYKKAITEMIIAAKKADRKFTFREIESPTWNEEFRRLSEEPPGA